MLWFITPFLLIFILPIMIKNLLIAIAVGIPLGAFGVIFPFVISKYEKRSNKAKKYVEKWTKELEDTKPSEKGFSEKSIREDRESH